MFDIFLDETNKFAYCDKCSRIYICKRDLDLSNKACDKCEGTIIELPPEKQNRMLINRLIHARSRTKRSIEILEAVAPKDNFIMGLTENTYQIKGHLL